MSKKEHNQSSIHGFFSKISKISLESKQEINENLAKNKKLHNENETKTQDDISSNDISPVAKKPRFVQNENFDINLSDPYHPHKEYFFPKKEFGKKSDKLRKYSAQHDWFISYKWLHYSIIHDSVFCFYCKKACLLNFPFTQKAK